MMILWTEADSERWRCRLNNTDFTSEDVRDLTCLLDTLAAVRRELFDIETRKASTCDLLNSWADATTNALRWRGEALAAQELSRDLERRMQAAEAEVARLREVLCTRTK